MFEDLLAANRQYAAKFHDPGIAGRAARRLAVLTCIDTRNDPLRMLGLVAGDAKIIRNAGARVTEDSLRSLILAVNLLDVDRICVVQHTDCAMVGSEETIRARVADAAGTDASDVAFLAMPDQLAALRADVEAIRACKLISPTTEVAGFMFDVRTGELIAP
jgi:carbonic anhydrase